MKSCYLAGKMTGTDGGRDLRRQIHAQFMQEPLIIHDPLNMTDDYCRMMHIPLEDILAGMPKAGIYQKALVARDLADQDLTCIEQADFLIAYINGFSYGTAGEITHAHRLGKRVYIWLADGEDIPFWLLGNSTYASKSLKHVVDAIRWMEL